MARRFRRLAARLLALLLFRGPTEIAGGKLVFYPREGLFLPVVAGGSPEGDGDGDGDAGKDAGKEGDAGKGAADGDAGKGNAGKAGAAGAGAGAGAGDDDDDDDEGAGKSEPDWKREARKHERREKAERKAREEAERKLKEREDADKSDQEKAIDEAKKAARAEAETEFETSRRQDRLEVAVTRVAAKGVTIKDGDGTKTARFADAEDALVHLERAISRGDVESDELFDNEGKVKSSELQSALADLLAEKPHLIAADNGGATSRKVEGDADAGKGKGADGDKEDMNALIRKQRAGR
jgi:hypothetical protein